jgi:hypothetical protein
MENTLLQIVKVLEKRKVIPDQIVLINMELMEFDQLKNYQDFGA